MRKFIVVLSIFFFSSIAVGVMIGHSIPTVEVKLDRWGACEQVTDFTTGEKHDCGWEVGRKYSTTY